MADETLDPNDPNAQSMVTGPGVAPISTTPVLPSPTTPVPDPNGQTPVPTPEDTTPAQVPPTGAVQESATSGATPPPMPQTPAEPTATPGTTTPPNAAVPDPEEAAISKMGLEDLIDPKLLAQLRDEASPHRSTFDQIMRALSFGAANMAKPGAAQQMKKDEDEGQDKAMTLLTNLQSQLSTYKREALRQHGAQKRIEGKQDEALRKTMYQSATQKVRDTMLAARKLGVVGPLPPTEEAILKDPESAQAWSGQMEELIANKQHGLEIITKQMPMFEQIARRGDKTPKEIERAFHDLVVSPHGGGLSEAEYQAEFASSGMVFGSIAKEQADRNAAYAAQKTAIVAHLKNVDMNKNREMFRLERALASNDAKSAMASQIRLAELKKEIKAEYQKAGMAEIMFTTGTATLPANPEMAAYFAKTGLDWKMQLDDIDNKLQGAVVANVKTFNTQDPATSFSDAKLALTPLLIAKTPELQTPGADVEGYIAKHPDDPNVQMYHDALRAQICLTSGTNQMAICNDYIDKQRTGKLSSVIPAPALPTPAAGPAKKDTSGPGGK